MAAFQDYVADSAPSSAAAPPAAEAAPVDAPAGGTGGADFPDKTVMGLPALSPTMTQGTPPPWMVRLALKEYSGANREAQVPFPPLS